MFASDWSIRSVAHRMGLVVLVLSFVLIVYPASGRTASVAPAGLAPTDWQAIRSLLPAQHAYLKASNTNAADVFGRTVAVSGDTVVVGADLEASADTGVDGDQTDNSAAFAGAAYVFVRSGNTWSQQAYLKASNTNSLDGFGGSVAVAGDTVVVGADWEESAATGINGNQADNSAANAGAAYVLDLAAPTPTAVPTATSTPTAVPTVTSTPTPITSPTPTTVPPRQRTYLPLVLRSVSRAAPPASSS